MKFALEAIESPRGGLAFAMENAEHALEHLCSSECRLYLPNDKCSSKAGSSNSAVLFFAPRVIILLELKKEFTPWVNRTKKSRGGKKHGFLARLPCGKYNNTDFRSRSRCQSDQRLALIL